jgi:hypothetical protein
MARKNNARNLRAHLWTTPCFCLFTKEQSSFRAWASGLQNTQTLWAFLKKVRFNTKNKKTKNI